MNNHSPNHPHERATEDQTWERSSLIPFLRHYYRVSDGHPNAEVEAEIARARRLLDCLVSTIANPPYMTEQISNLT
jgi:hypothetical protein